MATVGERIRSVREAAGVITQSDLARRVGMTPDKINKIEQGNRGVSAAELNLIAGALGVGPQALLREPLAPHYRGPHEKPGAEAALAKFDRFIENWLTADALLLVHDDLA